MFLQMLVKLLYVKLQEEFFSWFRVDEIGMGQKKIVEMRFCKLQLGKLIKTAIKST
jgi:hypothetical protein